MRLWLLERVQYKRDEDIQAVVRAGDETEARRITHEALTGVPKGEWLDPEVSTYVPIDPEGEPGVILEVSLPG